jgi:hypothetical protein
MSLHSRTCLAVGADSVGYEECHEPLFVGMKMPFPNATRMMLWAMKQRRDYDCKCQAWPKRKRMRKLIKFAGSKVELQKQMPEKAVGLSHGSGMNMEEELKNCRCCHESGHLTTKAGACKHNKFAIEELQAEMVSNHALKAAETAVLAAGAAAAAVE